MFLIELLAVGVLMLLTVGCFFLLLWVLIAVLAWREKCGYEKILEAMDGAREYGLYPRVSRPLTLEESLKAVKGQRGEPIFVVPVSEFRRVNVDGAGAFDDRVDDRQFVTLTPVRWTLDFIHDLVHDAEPTPFSGQLGPGVLTDFASIPSLVRRFAGEPTGRIARAAIVHDYGYRYDEDRSKMRRKEWDLTLLELMRRDGVKSSQRVLVYSAVRIFGCFAWRGAGDLIEDPDYQETVCEIARVARVVVRDFSKLFDRGGSALPPRYLTGYRSSIYEGVIAGQGRIIEAMKDSSSGGK